MSPVVAPEHISIWRQLGERLDAGRFQPRLATGVTICAVRSRSGTPYTLARRAGGGPSLRLAPWQAELLTTMDGTHTLKDLVLRQFQQEGSLSLDGISTLVVDLQRHGFLEDVPCDMYAALLHILHPPSRSQRQLARLSAILGSRWSTPWAVRLIPRLGRLVAIVLCRRTPSILLIGWIACGLLAIGIDTTLRAVAIGNLDRLGATALPVLLIGCWFAGVVYAFGRGAASQIAGWPPCWMGIRLRCGLPVPSLDVGDVALAGPRGTLLVAAAGPLSLLFCSATTGLLALFSPGATGVAQGTLLVALLAAVYALILLCPLLPLDGYGLLATTFDEQHLRAHAWSWGRGIVLRSPSRTLASPDAEAPFILYGLCCVLWLAIVLALALLGGHAGLGLLLGKLWQYLGNASALLPLVVLYLIACGWPRFVQPALRGMYHFATRFGLGGQHLSREVRRRLPAMRLSETLSSLTSEQLAALAREADEVTYPPGIDVVVQGEAGEYFYLVMEGAADVIDEGEPRVLERLRPGGSFGEYAMIYHTLRDATVRATTRLRLLRIGRPAFDAYLAPMLVQRVQLAALARERAALAAVPALVSLGHQALDLLLPRLIVERYAPGETIVRQGERGDRFYIIRSGSVEVLDERPTPSVRLNVLGNGAYFGEIALLLDTPRVATVRALVEVTVWSLSRVDFDQLLGRYLGMTDLFTGATRQRLAANRIRGGLANWPLVAGA